MHSQTGGLGKSTPVSEYTTAAELWERFGAPPRSVTTGGPVPCLLARGALTLKCHKSSLIAG